MESAVTLVPRPEDRRIVSEAASLLRFASLRLQAHHLLCTAASLPCLPDQHRAQATAAANLAGMRLHKVCGEARADDVERCRDDLYDIAKIVDRLIEALGATAKIDLGLADHAMILFREQLLGALDGNATHALTELADTMREDVAEQRCTSRHPMWAE